MSRFAPIADWLSQDRPGHTLPRELYVSEAAFQFDAEVMLKSVWLYACTVAHVKHPGDYFVFELASNSTHIEGLQISRDSVHDGGRQEGGRVGANPVVLCSTQNAIADSTLKA